MHRARLASEQPAPRLRVRVLTTTGMAFAGNSERALEFGTFRWGAWWTCCGTTARPQAAATRSVLDEPIMEEASCGPGVTACGRRRRSAPIAAATTYLSACGSGIPGI